MSDKTARLVNAATHMENLYLGICDVAERKNPYFALKVDKEGTLHWYPSIPFYVQHNPLCDREHPIGVIEAPSYDSPLSVKFYITDDICARVAEESEEGQVAIDHYNSLKILLLVRFQDRLADVAHALIGAKAEKSTLDLWQFASGPNVAADLVHQGKTIYESVYFQLEHQSHDITSHNNYVTELCRILKTTAPFAVLIDDVKSQCDSYVKEGSTSLPDDAPAEWGKLAGDFVSRAVYSATTEEGAEINISIYAGAKQNADSLMALDFTMGWEGVMKKSETKEEEGGAVVKMTHHIANVADAAIYSYVDNGKSRHYPTMRQALPGGNVMDKLQEMAKQAVQFVQNVKEGKPIPEVLATATVYRCR